MRRYDLAAAGAALVLGVAIGCVDSRPTWDDTGITVAALVIASGFLAFLRPRAWWAIALGVGLPVPVMNVLFRGGLGAAVALLFTTAAAGLGATAGRALGLAGRPDPS
jgi:hypothetical protein